jgi:hypothetical protein
MLTFEDAPQVRVLARTTVGSNAPIVVEVPVGGGHLMISGALDAWRYRADDRAAFDRFWQAAVAGGAAMSAPPVDAQIGPPVIGPGEEGRLSVRVRRTAFPVGPSEALRVSATVNGAGPMRLWPDGAADTFSGTFTAPHSEGVARVEVSVEGGAAKRVVETAGVIARDVRTARPVGPPLALLAQSRGGENVAAGHVAELAQRLRHDIVAPRTRVDRRPMRSAWWLLPFTTCLGSEWWLRRRRGLR